MHRFDITNIHVATWDGYDRIPLTLQKMGAKIIDELVQGVGRMAFNMVVINAIAYNAVRIHINCSS